MSFWEIMWLIVAVFAFGAFLMLLFHIVADLFRDPDVSGGATAAWVFALIFLPFASSLVYLITRGTGMAERSADQDEAIYR